MGGEHAGIADDTKRVCLEGAFWNPVVIQGKMKRLGFISDAGHRFERGVDFAGCARAVERATQLIIEICGGKAGPLIDRCGPLPSRDPVRVRPSRVARLLGVSIDADAIAATFTRLNFSFEKGGDDFIVTPPSYRFDLALEEDFIEEIVRLFGYDRVPSTPTPHIQRMLASTETKRSAAALKARLVARDWQEVITFTFVSSATEALLAPNAANSAAPIRVLNPIAAHLDVMRTTLLPGLLETLRTNVSRKSLRVRIFEVGRVFRHADAGFAQPLRIGGLAYGDAMHEQWGTPARRVDMFDVKADVDALKAAKPPYVERIEPFDVYRGPGLPAGKKSLAILVLMQDTERTLTDADIDAAMRTLLAAASERFGAALRE